VTLADTLLSVWKGVLVDGLTVVEIEGERCRVGRTRAQGLRTVSFHYQGELIEGIEQNPTKSSQWAKLAQEGKRIIQYKCRGRFVANVCEGTLMRYPAWTSLALPP
jgi:hypothetical protein